MESDDRFKHLAFDPRFKNLKKKQRKVQIDDRFKSMFTDKKFTLKYSKDKRGWRQNKTSADDLKKYYSLEDQEERVDEGKQNGEEGKRGKEDNLEKDDDNEDEDVGEKDDKDVSEVENEEDTDEGGERDPSKISEIRCNEDDSASELSSSSDESESETEDSDKEDEHDMVNLTFDWQPIDHDAETADSTTRRLAIQHLDWDHLDVRDIYTLVNSIRPPQRVRIYLSEYGKERLREEDIKGPKEIVEMSNNDEIEEEYNMLREKMKALRNPGAKSLRNNEYEDADEEMDPKNVELRERVRRYQLNRMKYYYAIVEFDSVDSAEAVYKELDGMDYEGSSLELDLRFVPDDIEFDDSDIKAECDKLPDPSSYKAPLFINSALQQTTVKFTWDQTDTRRQEKLYRAYTKEEIEKDDLDAYLASETDSDSDEAEDEKDGSRQGDDCASVVTANSEARVNKYKLLLKSLDDEEEKKKKVDVNIEWGSYSDEEKEVASAAAGKEKEVGSSEDDDSLYDEGDDRKDDYDDFDDDDLNGDLDDGNNDSMSDEGQAKEKTGRPLKKKELKKLMKKAKKEAKKEDKKKNKKDNNRRDNRKRMKEEESTSEDDELNLLVMDPNQRQRDEFKFDAEDNRFAAVYESGLYNIDPSHPNFKRAEAFNLIAEKKRQKRQRRCT